MTRDVVARALAEARLTAQWQFGRSDIEVDDVVSEVMIKFHNKFGNDDEPDNLAAWLHTVTQNTGRDLIKAHRRRDADRLDDEDDGFDLPSLLETSSTSLRALQPYFFDQLLVLLADNEAELIRMKYVENRAYADIAESIHKSEPATRKAVSRAVASLQKALGLQPDVVDELKLAMSRMY